MLSFFANIKKGKTLLLNFDKNLQDRLSVSFGIFPKLGDEGVRQKSDSHIKFGNWLFLEGGGALDKRKIPKI